MKFCDETTNQEPTVQQAVIKVLGLGGGGGNAVNHMAAQNYQGVEFICANTDAQALEQMNVDKTICIGAKSTTKGLGAGMKVEVGEAAALEDKETIKETLTDTDMLFIAAGMGGGTGTGSAPIVAQIAKELGILTVAVVTKPFFFEGKKKRLIADEGIKKLMSNVDSLIILPNDKLAESLGDDIEMKQIFSSSDDVLTNAVSSITELITKVGSMNLDFADIKTVMSAPGKAMMGSGISSGEKRAERAVQLALSNPLIEGVDLNNAQGILVNISSANDDVVMREYSTIGSYIEEYASESADIKTGINICNNLNEGEIKVTIVATGLSSHKILEHKKIENNEVKQVVGLDNNITDNIMQPQQAPQDLNHLNDAKLPAYLKNQRA
ncbi:Cell division protein FtsZ [hydrothermal vent metagenome]|uniref:Cell division protein FtsZ n=1 Tax=hydrothermal vent metagenome TaxID=652676 RepID=A0A1W1CGS3_9ZZZZ